MGTRTVVHHTWPEGLALEGLSTEHAAYPIYRQSSDPIHRRYIRTVADLPRHFRGPSRQRQVLLLRQPEMREDHLLRVVAGDHA